MFVLAALVVLGGFVLMLGDFSLSPGFDLYADYAYAGGLQVGAPVKLSGVKIGRVAALSLLRADATPAPAVVVPELARDEQPRVRARLRLERDLRSLLTERSRLYIGTQGLIGETYVELDPGDAAGVSPLAEGASVRGVDAPRLHVLALQLSTLAGTLGALAGLGREEGLGALSRALASLVATLSGVASDRKAELSSVIADAAAVAADLKAVSARLRAAAVEGDLLPALLRDSAASAALLRRDLPELVQGATLGLKAVLSLTEKVSRATDTADLAALTTQLQATLANLNQVSVDAQKVMDGVRRGEGSLGGFVTDPQVYEDTKALMRELKKDPWKLLWRE
ncbi:MAG: MCE family protein [Deltaproteobacteria bacterium]|nr:MCE family protein [Deltaproteobacteria bacterium]